MDAVVRWVHLLAAATWVGGMITVGALVPTLRKAGAGPEVVRAAAGRFGVVAWIAIGVAVITGVLQIDGLADGSEAALAVKLSLVGLGIALAWIHQTTARTLSSAWRGVLQGVLLLDGLAIVAAAVAL